MATGYDVNVVNKLRENASVKGFCTILDGLLGGLFCILSGYWVAGLIVGLLLIAVGVLYYYLQSGVKAVPTYNDNTTFEAPVSVIPMIASWPIALGAALLTANAAGKLGSLWGWIAGTFAFALLLQSTMWKETRSWGVKAARDQMEFDAFKDYLERIKDGEVCCASCGKRMRDHCAVAYKDGRAAALCSSCLPLQKGGSTEIQGMRFVYWEL